MKRPHHLLANRNDMIISDTDKGGAVVIQDAKDCITEAKQKLGIRTSDLLSKLEFEVPNANSNKNLEWKF